MIALFAILYVAGIWLFYVKMKVRPNPINLAVCTVIGILAIGFISICWQFSAPTTGQLVVTRHTIQIVPQVSGPITHIAAQPNVPLKKGTDVLFEIQKDLYQFAARQSQATHAAAEKSVQQLEAGLTVADATIAQATAEMGAAKAELDSKEDANRRTTGAVSELEIKKLQEKYAAMQATVTQAQAARQEATFALEVARQQVEQAQAAFDKANFDLSQCVVYAPANGFVTNWQVREGAMATPSPAAPLGTFIDTSDVQVVGIFSQNVLKNVQPGDKVEIAFKNHPGNIYRGQVVTIIAASGEGQFVTSGQLSTPDEIYSSGKFAVTFTLDDPTVAESLPMGTAGMATIYTKSGKAFQVISTVTVRIKAWMYYLLPF